MKVCQWHTIVHSTCVPLTRGVQNGFFNLGQFGTVFDKSRTVWNSVQNPKKPQFGSENIENIVLNFRKLTYKYKLVLMQCCNLANTETVKRCSSSLSVLRSQN
jgi:hypothetical protein